MRLSRREMTIAVATLSLILIAGFWGLVVDPANERTELLDRQIEGKKVEQLQMVEMSGRYKRLRSEIETAEKRFRKSGSTSILSYLEALATKHNVKKHISQMKPKGGESTKHYKEGVVEIKMERVSLDHLVRYLYQVENSPEQLRIKTMRMRSRFDNPDLLDVTFRIASYTMPEDG